MKSQVKFVAWESKLHPRAPFEFEEQRYNFRSDRKHQWLQKACFWILEKLRCQSIMHEIEYERHTVDTEDFIDQLIEQCGILDNCYGEHPKKVLVGSKVYQEITGNLHICEKLHFERGIRMKKLMPNGRFPVEYFMGLEVIVVPWMEGVLVMPDF